MSRSQMRQSLMGREMSTRLRNVLCNMADYPQAVHSWEELVEAYRSGPDEMDIVFLRTPGGGRKSLDELKSLIGPELRGITKRGDTVFLSGEDVQRIRDAIEEACTYCPVGIQAELRIIEAFFTASTIRTRLPGG